jgi:3-oxoacyl-[acyl-carrier-protein] synthase-3
MDVPVTEVGKALSVQNVALRGIVSAVPDTVVGNAVFEDKFGAKAVAEISRMTVFKAGAYHRKTRLQLTYPKLLPVSCWKNCNGRQILSMQLYLCPRRPDYRLPATACALQARLQLSAHCAAFDVNLGCSGYVYGLWIASKLIDGTGIRRVLLLAGDTSTKLVNPEDRATAMLFGDAGTATALEFDESAAPCWYVLGTDGSGEKNLIVPRSQYRTALPSDEKLSAVLPDYLYMDGAEVFNFTIRSVPTLVNQVLKISKKDISALTHVFFSSG